MPGTVWALDRNDTGLPSSQPSEVGVSILVLQNRKVGSEMLSNLPEATQLGLTETREEENVGREEGEKDQLFLF